MSELVTGSGNLKMSFLMLATFHVWFQEAMLLRHHNEAESLHAVQKLDWEWKMKELGMCDLKSTPVIDVIHVPMVHVSDDFDLLPV